MNSSELPADIVAAGGLDIGEPDGVAGVVETDGFAQEPVFVEDPVT
jgi:hypothetical protein